MGSQLGIKKYINHELKKNQLTLDKVGEIEFNNLFSSNPNYDGSHDYEIKKSYFRYIMQISKEEKFETIFKIFGEKKENDEQIITLESLKYLYFSFTTDNSRIKLILITFIIFDGNESIDKDKINKKFCDLFNNNEKMLELTSKIMPELYSSEKLNKPKKRHKDSGDNFEIQISINDFLKYCFVTGKNNEFNDFIFLKKFTGSSQFKLAQKNNNLDFYCDCHLKTGKNIDERIATMKSAFKDKTNNTNKALDFKEYKKMLKANNIHENLINLTTDFMKLNTLKEYCCFEDINYLFSNLDFSIPIDDKKKFIFKMISTINNNEIKLTYEQIAKYLNIEEAEKKEEIKNEINEIIEKNDKLYDENEFMKDDKFNDMIIKLNYSIENFGLLPYFEFKVKSEDKTIKKRLINDILKNNDIDNYEKYLESEFEVCDYFYAINK